MPRDTKSRAAVVVVLVLLAAALAAVIVLGVLGIGEHYTVTITVLAVIAALVAAGVPAVLSLIKASSADRQRPSQQQATGTVLIAGLLGISLVAMVVLAVNFGPAEIEKEALGGLIALSGVAVSTIVTQLRTEAVRRETHDRQDETARKLDTVEAETTAAREKAEQSVTEGAAARHAAERSANSAHSAHQEANTARLRTEETAGQAQQTGGKRRRKGKPTP